MAAAKTTKTYVRPDNTAAIHCPQCGRQKSVPVDSYKGIKSSLKIKCACKHVFTVNLEFRKRVRKRVNLHGTYINHSKNGARGSIIVRNVSVDGLEFASVDIHNFHLEDELTVEFTLDDAQRSEIKKDAIVRNVRPRAVGCQFERSGDLAFDGPLGFYIMS